MIRSLVVLGTMSGLFVAAYLVTRDEVTMPMFFGDKQVAMFDLWSFQHFVNGIWFTVLVAKREPRLLSVGIVAYSWEAAEWWMESGGLGVGVASWKAGYEHWSNRLIADPALALLGAQLAIRLPKTAWFALVASLIWFVVNVTAPNCMIVQQRVLTFFTP